MPFWANLKGEQADAAAAVGYDGERIEDPGELYDLLRDLIAEWEDGDDAAGDLASGIMQVIGYEWI
jgi:hypothetical protein